MAENKPVALSESLESSLQGLKLGQLKKLCYSFFKEKLNGTSVKNKQKGITVAFNMRGVNHLLYARNAGYVKLKDVFILKELIQNAVFCNFKNPDANDSPDIIGYLNFKSKAKIEGSMQTFRVVIRLTSRGRFFYDHSVRVKK